MGGIFFGCISCNNVIFCNVCYSYSCSNPGGGCIPFFLQQWWSQRQLLWQQLHPAICPPQQRICTVSWQQLYQACYPSQFIGIQYWFQLQLWLQHWFQLQFRTQQWFQLQFWLLQKVLVPRELWLQNIACVLQQRS